MGCCGKKSGDDDEEMKNAMVPVSERKCRDVLCCALFIAYWFGMIIVAMIGMKQGQPLKLIYGKDFAGNICGDKAFVDRKFVYYPRLNEDMLYALQNNIPVTSINFYGICVKKCPAVGEIHCGYGNSNCWTSSLATENIFYRCLPSPNTNRSVVKEECVEPVDATPNCSLELFFKGNCSKICKVKRQKIISWETKESTPNPLLTQLQGVAQTLGRLIGDIKKTASTVLLVGGGGSLVLGVIWLMMLQVFAGLMVWLTCFFVILLLAVLSLYCSAKAEIINPSSLGLTSSINNVNMTAQLSASTTNEKTQFTVAAYISWVFTGVLFLLILAMKKRIKIAVAIIREASKCIQAMPLLIFWPIVPTTAVVCVVMYWIAIAAYILSANSISFSDVTNTVNQAAGSSLTTGNITTNGTALTALPSSSAQDVLFVYNLFGLLWTNQLIQAISICTIGGAVAEYYWTAPNQFGNRDIRKFPIASSLARTMRFSLGSLCFGSLIIAVVQLARIALEYIDHNTKDLQESNTMVKITMKAVKCCLWCFEKCLKFLSKNAYIIIAMKGTSFCSSAKKAFFLILSNVARFAVVNTISFFLLFLAKIAITTGVGVIVFSTVSKNAAFQIGGSSELSSPFAPVIVAITLAYFVSSTFMNVYDMAIDTILLCFCEDSKLNNQRASQYMSKELQKIMGGEVTVGMKTPENVKSGNMKNMTVSPKVQKNDI